MAITAAKLDLERVSSGYDATATRSLSLRAEAYTDPAWHVVERDAIFARSWQWVCHGEALRERGAYVATEIAGRPVVLVRDRDGVLRGFYNVCKHRAHHLVQGRGTTTMLTCPYHAWTYGLDGRLMAARHTEHLEAFDRKEICLDAISVEEFCGFVYANLDPAATPLAVQSGALGDEIRRYAPDVDHLTFARRLTYDIASNWKNVIDNFLECYHCHVAHKDFVSLVDMDTYKVATHGIYSSHMAEAGKGANTAYSVEGASVRDHAVWWLWPNTCLLRYPGRGNFLVLQVIPVSAERTVETYDFYFEEAEPNAAEAEAIRYVDEVLQVEDIDLVESVQKGMNTPAFNQGRIVVDPDGSGLSEHGLHHFHGLVLDAYRKALD